ncbi:hypothetical protein JHK85_015928 [Glycine max]|nr:hypothetical protein JHK85_015928 [Glycine max]
MANPRRLKPKIRRFVLDIYRTGDRPEAKHLISRIPFLVPKMKKDWFTFEDLDRFYERLGERLGTSQGDKQDRCSWTEDALLFYTLQLGFVDMDFDLNAKGNEKLLTAGVAAIATERHPSAKRVVVARFNVADVAAGSEWRSDAGSEPDGSFPTESKAEPHFLPVPWKATTVATFVTITWEELRKLNADENLQQGEEKGS